MPSIEEVHDILKDLRGEFSEFKQEFTTRMYIGNGKPAVMTTLQSHEEALSDIHASIAKVNNRILEEEEHRCKDVEAINKKMEPVLQNEEKKSFIKKYWKALAIFGIFSFIMIALVIAGLLYIDSKIPAINKILAKLGGL